MSTWIYNEVLTYAGHTTMDNCLGWVVDPISGTLTVTQLNRDDGGEYTCTAENSAGRLQGTARLSIVIKYVLSLLMGHSHEINF
jgi:hypothetical protein